MAGVKADLIKGLLPLAREAGAAILKVYSLGEVKTTYKEGGSPLTEADSAAHDIIAAGLGMLTPGVPVLSEESRAEPYGVRRNWKSFWLVDPLDGTKEFLNRNGEFTVNIALIEDGAPVLGLVYAPVLDVAYYGIRGAGAFKAATGSAPEPIRTEGYTGGAVRVVASRSHRGAALEAFLERIKEAECLSMGSSLKLCLVAEGRAHLYPRFGPTMEWDTAAAHSVVEAAGGSVMDFEGRPLEYNKEDLTNPFFMVTGSPPFPWKRFL
jgi:3'(2'), 5'-bisphosphate nucleotidase